VVSPVSDCGEMDCLVIGICVGRHFNEERDFDERWDDAFALKDDAATMD
jgi:hypothetical protein